MLTNYHTHTTFCDGKGTPEQVVLSAIKEGFDAIGFSGHGYTEYDLRYCMKDVAGYIREVVRLREKYKEKIEIYLGIEEDSRHINNRADFDYIIGSCHYVTDKNGTPSPVDSNIDYFKKGLSFFGGDPLALAEQYYSHFTDYILKWKPDIIGHFDLVTKFEEKEESLFLENEGYWKIAEAYAEKALLAGSFFEINTGLITRGYRTSPCPHDRLLRIIHRCGGGVVLSSDSHSPDTLSAYFDEAKSILRDIGFKHTFALIKGKWVKDYI